MAQAADKIGRCEIEQFMAYMARTGRSPRTTLNALLILRSSSSNARREYWVLATMHVRRQATRRQQLSRHPLPLARRVHGPVAKRSPHDDIGRVERRVYLTAMPGMRKLDQYMKTRHRGDDDLVFPAGKPIYRSKPLSASRPRSGRARARGPLPRSGATRSARAWSPKRSRCAVQENARLLRPRF
jgi:hypothetical protein